MESFLVNIIFTVVGGGITMLAEWIHFRRGLRARRRVAEMLIASQIRLWLIETTQAFYKESYAEPPPNYDPNGHVFPTPNDIPHFQFKDSLESISLLQRDDARGLFDIIVKRWEAELEVQHIAFLQDHEEAALFFEPCIAQLFLDCYSIYTKLAKRIGWSELAVTEDEMNKMREKAVVNRALPSSGF